MSNYMSNNILKKIIIIISSFLSLTAFTTQNNIVLPSNSAPIQMQDFIAPEPSSGFNRKEIYNASNFMIVTGHNRATEAGYKILKKGGNAIDAAIAAQMVLNIVEPHASGIGGGGFLLYYNHKNKNYEFFDGRETAPQNIDPNIFLNKKGEPKDFFSAITGGASVGTPGLLKMLQAAHAEYGKLPWFELFTDAIDIASLGYDTSPRGKKIIEETTHIKEFKETKKNFLTKESNYEISKETIKNDDLANIFREIAKNGINDFYHGNIAKNIVETVQNSKPNPGSLTLEDMQNYQIRRGKLICLEYRRKYNICSMPAPSSGGITLLQILGILENFDMGQMEANSVEAIHVISEAMRLAYSDRNMYLADSDFVEIPVLEMLDKEYLRERSYLINVDAALINVSPGSFKSPTSKKYSYHQKIYEPNSTTHISIIDGENNSISLTSSIEHSFGSGLISNGFMLNNQLTDFSFISEKNGLLIANRIEPLKRPRSSMTPTFIFDKNDNLLLTIGSPGGARIISYIAKSIIAFIDWEMPIADAVNLPNFNKMNNILELESNTNIASYQAALENIGHVTNIRDLNSGIHAISIMNNELSAGIDIRREGTALGE
jgi:gamma-glutamyltranspeptidase/glutathione hydrolase